MRYAVRLALVAGLATFYSSAVAWAGKFNQSIGGGYSGPVPSSDIGYLPPSQDVVVLQDLSSGLMDPGYDIVPSFEIAPTCPAASAQSLPVYLPMQTQQPVYVVVSHRGFGQRSFGTGGCNGNVGFGQRNFGVRRFNNFGGRQFNNGFGNGQGFSTGSGVGGGGITIQGKKIRLKRNNF